MIPLGMSVIGEENIIRRVGGNPEIKKHLEDLGFVPGEHTVVIAAPGSGNIIVSAGGTSLFDVKIENGHLYKTINGTT